MVSDRVNLNAKNHYIKNKMHFYTFIVQKYIKGIFIGFITYFV